MTTFGKVEEPTQETSGDACESGTQAPWSAGVSIVYTEAKGPWPLEKQDGYP